MWLTRLAIKRPITVVMILLSLLVLGAISVQRLPLNFLPNEEFPFIGVFIPYPNGIPAQVEREIARPIEEILATLGGVKEIFSESDSDQCFVGVEFDWGRDVNILRLEVKEKLDQIRPDLPADIQEMLLFTFDTNDIPIVEGRISATGRDLASSYDLIEHRVVNRLQRIPGVGQVNLHGVEPAAVSVYLKLDKIKEHDVDVGKLFGELSESNFNLTVGQVTKDGLRYNLRAVGTLDGLEAIRDLPIGGDLRLSDVADVVYEEPIMTYGRTLNREIAVAFWIQKASEANTVDVVEEVKKELAAINSDPALEGIDVLMFFDQGAQITNSLEGLLEAGLIGGVLAVAVLYFFLLRLGTTLIVGLAIPISVVGACCFLYLSHRSLNILSMMGLMLAVGMLIDNAVVVLESIYRRMGMGESPAEATVNGTRDVGKAVVSATLTTIIVFAPVVFGANNELFVWLKEIGITITVTLLLSLLVSLTIIPLLTSHLLKGGGQSVARNPIVERWADRYARILGWCAVKRPWTSLSLTILGVVITIVAIKVTSFGPDPMGERGIRQEYLQLTYDFSDNLNYHRTKEYVDRVEDILWPLKEELGMEYLYSFYQDNYALTRMYFAEETLSESELKRLRESVRDTIPEMAGVKFNLGGEDGSGSGAKRFSVTVHGEDSELLADISSEVKRRLALIDDVEDIATNIERGAEEVRVHVDHDKASRFGVSSSDIAQIMGITFRGVRLPKVRAQDREIDLWVLLRPEDRKSIENLAAMTVTTVDDKEISLAQVADMRIDRGASEVRRLNQKTSVQVYGSYEGEKFDEVLDEVRATMDTMHFPAGYGWNFGTRIRESQQQQADLLVNALLAVLCIYMVMASLFESLVHPLVVMPCLLFAWMGSFWLMVTTNTPFNIMAIIGIVILNGIVVNNGIVLVDHINHLRKNGKSINEAILMGGRERFRPILMTATTTVLGLIPLALGKNHIGDAEMYPMARALMGGLLGSTILTLILIPVFYQIAERLRVRSHRGFGLLYTGELIARGARRLGGRRRGKVSGAEVPGATG